ncbi:hypothetical protein KE624_01320 [Shewanella algae]|uniref:hypothetical protein n=1 Tax=Shewanella algae TaxID=38313 RepID=UPI001C4AC355|nr:hypothetical protein [Shewanella algae]QXP38451.1 hypothetical protein KE624_01320 [Shewanella algae]
MPQSFFASTRDALSIYFHKRVLILLLLGFSAGLPLMLVFSTLSFWLREAGVDRAAIGYFSWVALIYAFKWAWSPWSIACPCLCSANSLAAAAAGCCSPSYY